MKIKPLTFIMCKMRSFVYILFIVMKWEKVKSRFAINLVESECFNRWLRDDFILGKFQASSTVRLVSICFETGIGRKSTFKWNMIERDRISHFNREYFQWPLIRKPLNPNRNLTDMRAIAYFGKMLKIKITDINFIGSLFLI